MKILFAICMLASVARAGGSPSLDHTGIALGADFEVRVAGAPSRAPVGLLFSPQAAEIELVQGTLELDPATMQLVGSTEANEAGEASFAFSLGAEESLAEILVHLQGFVVDGSAPGGGVLTDAIHRRVLGSRVYGFDEASALDAVDMIVLSAVTDEVVYVSAYDEPESGSGQGEMLFDALQDRGAFTAGTYDLRLFDTNTGEFDSPEHRTARHLAADPDGESFWALSYFEDVVLRISFESGDVIDSFEASPADGGLGTLWAANDSATLAFAAVNGVDRPQVVGIDLEAGAALESMFVGKLGDTSVTNVVSAGEWFFVVTTSPHGDTLTQIDTSIRPPFVLAHPVGIDDVEALQPLPTRGEVLLWRSEFEGLSSWDPFRMVVVPIGAATPLTPVDAPTPAFGSGQSSFDSFVFPDDATGWFSRRCCQEPPFGDEAGSLWSFDVATRTWSASPNNLFHGPFGVAVVDDAFGHRVFLGRADSESPFDTAQFEVFDAATLEKNEIPVPTAVTLRAHQASVVP